MFTLSYVAKAAFDGIRECLGCRYQTISDLKVRNAVLEDEANEKDLRISSQDEAISSMD